MLKHFLLLLISTCIYAQTLTYELEHLNPNQSKILNDAYNAGKKFDYGYTMAAIAWQESHFGKYMLNLNDPSCGVMHVMPRYLINKTSLKNTAWNRSRLCERLISDNDFSYAAALLELEYWENYWRSQGVGRVWSHTVSSYNAGFKWKNGTKYLKEIRSKVKLLKTQKELK